ncbi:indolepyruvate oxidoreductase subunit beta [Chloroflexota bacterium]
MKNINLLITGVGGQGVILASDIIGDSAITSGYDVKKTDTLGMAQRGGSVISNIRIASKVWSPLIKKGEADIMLAFEKLEAARWAQYIRPQGIAIVNNQALPPLAVSIGADKYPNDDEVGSILKQRTDTVYFIDGRRRASELGNIRTFNIFLLGCVSLLLPFKVSVWKASIEQRLPAGIREINLHAFDQGRKEMRSTGL